MERNEKRNLVISFDKMRLHSSINLHLKRSNIPTTMMGTDLLRGVIFGMVRHPEITLNDAIANSVDAASFLGNCMTVEDGYDRIFEVLETVMDIDYSKPEEEVIRPVIEGFVTEIRKEFCYEITVKTLEKELPNFQKYSIGWDFIKCMVFKKIYAPDSTYECMLDYALRKVGKELDEKDFTFEKAMKYLNPFLQPSPAEEQLKEMVEILEEKVYEFALSISE